MTPMNQNLVITLLVVAVATLVVYVAVERVLPSRWRKSEVEASDKFGERSRRTPVLDPTRFRDRGVLADYDKASTNTQQEANALGADLRLRPGSPGACQVHLEA